MLVQLPPVAAALLLSASSSAPASDGPGPVSGCRTDGPEVRAIHKVIDQFTAAIDRGDVDALMSAYADDLVYMPDGMVTHGKAMTRSGFTSMLGKLNMHIAVKIDELEVCGPVAYDLGSVTISMTRKSDGKPLLDTIRFLEIWHKDNGSWKAARVMNNKSPAEAPTQQPDAAAPPPRH